MKFFSAMMVLAAFAVAFGQNTAAGTMTEVSNYGGETEWNGGGKVSCRVGNGGVYSTLARFDLSALTPTVQCTLFVKQADTYFDSDTGTNFLTKISSVMGTWVTGHQADAAEEGSVCYKYRAYSATTPVYWVDGTSSSTVESASQGVGGTHVNGTALHVKSGYSGELSYVALDSQVIYDLKNGCGGIRICVAPGNGAKMRLSRAPGATLRWNPNATPITVAVEKAVPAVKMGQAMNVPNPFTPATTIHFSMRSRELPVRIFNAAGVCVRTLKGINGKAVWDGKDSRGQVLSSGIYVYRIADAGQTAQGWMVFAK